MPRTARIFAPDNLLRIQQMAAEGGSSIEIAKIIGSTPASVRVMCCHHKIKISHGRRSIKVNLPASLTVKFHRKAERMQIPASVLATRLLAAIAASDIYEAVLDDRD